METTIDYFSVNLSDKLSEKRLRELIASEQIDATTGEISPPLLRHDQFRIVKVKGGPLVCSFYRGGEKFGLQLAKEFELKPTRVDIAVTVPFEDEKSRFEIFDHLHNKAKQWRDNLPYSVQYRYFDGQGKSEYGRYGFTLFSRQSGKHIRVYARDIELRDRETRTGFTTKLALRFEWELHGDIAREIYSLFSEFVKVSPKRLFNIHQTITAKWIGQDFWELGPFKPVTIELFSKQEGVDSYLYWLLFSVPRSMYRHFKATGQDLLPALIEQYSKFQSQGENERLERENKRTRQQIAAMYSKLTSKFDIPLENPPE